MTGLQIAAEMQSIDGPRRRFWAVTKPEKLYTAALKNSCKYSTVCCMIETVTAKMPFRDILLL
jgi:hypothetical protein